MPAPLVTAGLFAGGSALLKAIGSLFGRKEEAGYAMSAEEKRVLAYLEQEMGTVPSSVTEPFAQARQKLRKFYGAQPVASGLQMAGELQIGAKESEAIGSYRRGIMEQIASLVSGKGTRWAKQGGGAGGFLGELAEGGEDIGVMLFLKELGIFDKQVGKPTGISPLSGEELNPLSLSTLKSAMSTGSSIGTQPGFGYYGDQGEGGDNLLEMFMNFLKNINPQAGGLNFAKLYSPKFFTKPQQTGVGVRYGLD